MWKRPLTNRHQEIWDHISDINVESHRKKRRKALLYQQSALSPYHSLFKSSLFFTCGGIVTGIYSHSSIPEGGRFQDPSGCQNRQMLNSHAMGFPYAPILHPQIQATRRVWYFLSAERRLYLVCLRVC